MTNTAGAPEQTGVQFYQELLARATDIICVVDAGGTVRYASPALARIMGHSSEALLGGTAFAHVHADDVAAVRAAIASAVAAEDELVAVTFRCRHVDGSYRVLEATYQNRLRDGVVGGLVINARDVTERVRADEDHRAQQDHIRASLAALAGMAGALVQTGGEAPADDEIGLTESILRLACEAIGARWATVSLIGAGGAWRAGACYGLGRGLEEQWRSGQPGTGLRECITAGELERLQEEGLLLLESTLHPRRRLPYDLQAALLAMLSTGSRLVGVLSLDMSSASRRLSEEDLMLTRAVASLVAFAIERDRLIEERAASAVEELAMQETGRRMDAFLALVTHELRTPLTAASGNVQIAQLRLAQEAASEMPAAGPVNVALSRALRALERMNVLIGDLMDASHPRTDLFVTRRARCDLTTVVREAVEELPELAPRQVRLDIAPEPLLCDADAGRISQVVHNYLSNALKYAPEQSPIEVGVRSEGGKARLWVRDGGPGIPLEDQPRIWERFYRVEGIPHQPGTRAGLGLGLYISRAIVEQHGGEVGVESGAGGSTFWFTIPLAETVS